MIPSSWGLSRSSPVCKIHSAAWRAEQPRVGVPIVDRDGQFRVNLGKAFNAGRKRGFVGDVTLALVLILGELPC